MDEQKKAAPQDESNRYWLIERGSPAEWWVRGSGKGDGTMLHEEWTTDSFKAQRFNEWGAKTHAEELMRWGVKGQLRATEHLDMNGPILESPAPAMPEEPLCPCSFQHLPHDACSGEPVDLRLRTYAHALRARCGELEGQIKNLAPTGRYNGLDIEGWYQRAAQAERDRDLLAKAVRDVQSPRQTEFPSYENCEAEYDDWRKEHAAAIDAASKSAGEK